VDLGQGTFFHLFPVLPTRLHGIVVNEKIHKSSWCALRTGTPLSSYILAGSNLSKEGGQKKAAIFRLTE